MKKLLILLSLILCLGTSVFAANDELGLYFVFPFNQYESNGNDASGFGGMIDYKRMHNNIWGIEYEGSLIFPKKGTPNYNKFLTFDLSAGLALRLFNNESLELFLVPSVGFKYASDNLWVETKTDHVYSYIWVGGAVDLNYKITSVLYLSGGVNLEYSFYKIQEAKNEAVDFISVVPKVGLTLIM